MPEGEGDVTADRLKEIKARAEAATEGPWVQGDGTDASEYGVWAGHWSPQFGGGQPIARTDIGEPRAEDAEFITHARSDVPWLLDRVVAAEAQLPEYEARVLKQEGTIKEYRGRSEAAEARAEQLEGLVVRLRDRASQGKPHLAVCRCDYCAALSPVVSAASSSTRKEPT